jgi:protein phosphatase
MKMRDALQPEPPQDPAGKIEMKKTPEILDGRETKDLVESMHVFELKSGDMVYAGTDKGINYKDRNEDRVVVYPEKDFIAVVDGMGGRGKGEVAAQILATKFIAQPRDISNAVNQALEEMDNQMVGEGGAVFISAQLNVIPNGKFLDIDQSGDAKLIIIKKDGTVEFESKDESRVQDLLDAGIITPDEALYHPNRNVVTKAVSPAHKEDELKFYPPVKVEDGDQVLLYSDGISDNFTPEEITKMVKRGLSGKELFSWLSSATGTRMQNAKEIKDNSTRKKDGIYSDGYKSEPKPDNCSLIIMEIKNKKNRSYI